MFWEERYSLGRSLKIPVLSLQILLCCAVTANAQGVDPWKPNDQSFEGYMARLPMSRAAEAEALKFIEAAAKGSAFELSQMMSPESIEITGRDTAERYLNQSVIPFFFDHKEFGRSQTITTARTASGNAGFAIYRYSVRTDGEKRPFVIYVTLERGIWRVANILVDHYVPDRHRPQEQ